MIRVSVFSNRT